MYCPACNAVAKGCELIIITKCGLYLDVLKCELRLRRVHAVFNLCGLSLSKPLEVSTELKYLVLSTSPSYIGIGHVLLHGPSLSYTTHYFRGQVLTDTCG